MNIVLRLSFVLVWLSCLEYNLAGQCNITPTLTSTSFHDGPGTSLDYFVVCTEGASTGALIVANGIAPNFLSSFNNYTVSWGDGSTNFTTTSDVFQNPTAVHEYSVGNYILTFSASTSTCTVTQQYNVYVGNSPSVSMGSPGGTEGCSEVTISFPISDALLNIPTTTYEITFSDGSAPENYTQPPPPSVSHTFNESSCGETFLNSSNSYGVTIVAINECGDAQVSVAPVRISAPPVADFTATAETICTAGSVTFDDTSDPGTTATSSGCGSNARFYWSLSPSTGWSQTSGSFGSNNGLPNTLSGWTTGTDQVGVNFTAPGTYTMTLNYRNSCGPSVRTRTICVVNPPTCGFNVNTDSGCGPLSVVTTNTSTGPQCGNSPLALSYAWTVNVPTGGSYTVSNGTLSSASPTFNLTNTGTSPLVYILNLQVSIVNPQTGAILASCSSNCQRTITVYPAPVISSHPTPLQTICVGGTPNSLSVAYQYGVGTPTYQWYSNTSNSNSGGTIISGATSATYSPPTLNTAGNFYYYAVISLGGNCGTITSNPATVTVVPDPTISTQPTTPQTICSGGSASPVSMAYTGGTGTPTYQWYSNTSSSNSGGTTVPGATSSSFTPTVPTAPGSYYFYGTVSLSGSGCNAVATNVTTVNVIADPTIAINGQPPTYCQNAPSSAFTTTVTGGSGNNSYQWFQSASNSNSGGTIINGQTNAGFSPPTTTVGTQYYYVQLTQAVSGCSNVSAPIQVVILPAASISTQPQPSTVCVGGTPTPLSVAYVNGSGTPSYQWYSNTSNSTSGGNVILGATNATYTPPTTTAGTIFYYAVVSFTSGGCSNITSSAAAVNVLPDPAISTQPSATQTLCVGGTLATPLSVTATGGSGGLTYQWFSNTTASNSGGTIISGATNSVYTPPAQSVAGSYHYYVTVSSAGSGCETVASAVASVSVIDDPTVSAPTSTQSVCQGAPATALSVNVSGGSGTNSYTWFSNAANSTTGGTSVGSASTYTPSTAAVGTLYYYVVVSQSVPGCSATSVTGQVVVTPAASITVQPSPSTLCVGGTATPLTITHTTGIGTPTYQWFSSGNSNGTGGTPVAGATSITYAPPTTQAGTVYYYVVVSFTGGGCNNLTSNATAVTVLADPTVSLQTVSPVTVCAGNALTSPLSFTVTGGTGTLSYQWYSSSTAATSNGNILSGAISTSYNPPVFNQAGSFYYYATVVANGNGCDATNTPPIEVVVNAAATAAVSGPYSTCGSAPVSVSANASGTGQWSAPVGSGSFTSASSAATSFTPASSTPQSITLTWTTSDPDGSGPCPSVSANTTVTIFAPATASLPSTGSVCTNAVFSLNATTNSPGSWSSTGTGAFSNTTTATSSYTPAAGDVGASPITLTWTTNDPDGSGPCVSVSASQVVAVFAPPVVSAGQDQVLCLNTPQVTLSGTPSGGTWAGTGVSAIGSFNPNQVGTYTLTYSYTDANGCSLSDQMVLNVNQSAIADANGPYTTCGLAPIQISATTNGTGTWTGGAGTFASASSAATTYTPASSEIGTTVTLTWETFDPDNAGPCSGASDNAQLTVNEPAVASIGGPYSICSSDVANIEVSSTPGTGSWSGGTGSYGSTSQQSTTYDPSSTEGGTTVNITWTTTDPDGSGPCTPAVVSTTINVLEAAIADANGPYFTCGLSPIQISATTNGTGTWTGGAGTFASASSAATTYTPASSEIGSTVTLTWETFDPDNAGPCSGASDNAQLTVNIPAVASIGGPYSICSSDVANIQVSSTPSTGSWSGGTGTYGSTSQQSTTYDPSSTEGGTTVNITWTTTDPDANGPCTAAVVSTTINVLEAAIADANGPYIICGLSPIQISATTNGTGTWSGGAGTFASASSAATTYTPASSEIGTTITLTWETFDPDNAGPCSGASDNAQLTANEPAVASIGGPYSICSSDVANIEVSSTPGTGSWSGGTGSYGSTSQQSTTYDPSSTEGGTTVNITWTTTDPDGSGPCTPAVVSTTINVLEAAIADAGGPYEICGAQAIDLNAVTNGTGTWTGGTGTFENTDDPVSSYLPSMSEVGTTVTLTWSTFDPDGDGPCTGASDDATVAISTPAAVSPGGPYAICSNGEASISVESLPDQGTWTGGSGSFNSNSNSTSIYTPGTGDIGNAVPLTWTTIDPDGAGPCTAVTAEVVVNVLEEATAIITGPLWVCANATVDLSVEANGPGEWSLTPTGLAELSDESSSTPTLTPLTNDFEDEELQISWTTFDPDGDGPCTAFTTTETFSIASLPSIELQTNYTIDCGDPISATASGGSGQGYQYQWSPTIGLVTPDQSTTPVNASGTYTLTVTDSNGCSNEAETEVAINALDQMASAPDVETCLFEPIQIQGEATLGLAPFTYTWSPSIHLDAANVSDVEFVYNGNLISDSVFTLTFSVMDALGCADNETVNVTVHPLPVVDAGADIGVCADEVSFQLSDYSPAESSGISGDWAPSQNVDPGALPIGDNEFVYTFTDLNSCVNSDELVITVHEVPVANYDVPLLVCEGENVLFANQSTCASCGPLSYIWRFGASGDELTTASPTYIFSDTGFVSITLVVLSNFGCVDSITKTIHVLALPETGFSLDIHSGCGPLEVAIDNTTVGSELTYNWNIEPFGASSFAEPGSVVFPEAPCDSIFYAIRLTASNICGAVTVNDSVLVYAKPYPEFVLSTDTICSSLPLSLYNSSSCAWNTTYSWDLGDGSMIDSQELSIDNVYFSDQNFESYDIVLSGTNECGTRDTVQTITVVPNSITAFFNANPISGCEPLEVNYDQQMFGVTYFSWEFGDGANSLEEDPTHVFLEPGQFETVFIAGNFCGAQDTAYQTITVLPAPVFDFEVSDQFLCVGEATDFTILGSNISGFQWDFGDGGTSNQPAPSHIYAEEGVYEVSLTATSTVNGCPATYTNDIEVILTPTAAITSDIVAGCSPLLVNFQNETTDAINYFWNLGDGNQYVGDSLSYSFLDPGVYSVEVVAINSNSCADTVNVDITVYPKPTAAFNMSLQDLDEYLRVGFQNQSVNAVAYQWNFGDGNVSFITNPAYRYSKLGDCDYTPFLIAFNEFGCTDTAYREILLSFEMRVWAPNSFTPNDDGLNDRFMIETIDVDPTTARLAIFDRWGVLVHESVGLYPGWDGKINGVFAPNDVYVWRLYSKTKCGYEDKSWVGHVSVIR